MSVESARKFREATRTAFTSTERTGTEMVAAEILFDKWKPGNYALNDVRRYKDQLWRCCQAHDSTASADWFPGNVAALWAPYHTTDPAAAKPFIQPAGAHDAYLQGEVCIWTDGKIYRSIMDSANAYSPEAYPAGWEQVEGSGA